MVQRRALHAGASFAARVVDSLAGYRSVVARELAIDVALRRGLDRSDRIAIWWAISQSASSLGGHGERVRM